MEDPKTAIFVKSTSTSLNVNTALTQLAQLKKPHAIPFNNKTSNKNLHPFEDASSLEFWSQKNDAAFIVSGSSSKKRPNNLIITRMFDHAVLDMLEIGVDLAKGMADYKVRLDAVITFCRS